MYQIDSYIVARPPILAGPYPIKQFLSIAMVKEFAAKGTKITVPVMETAQRDLKAADVAKLGRTEMATMPPLPQNFPGGLKTPHVHYNGDIFLLGDKEWQAFSSKIIEDFRAKLKGAKSINYDQLIRLSDIMQEII
jgi:hypothetical protein